MSLPSLEYMENLAREIVKPMFEDLDKILEFRSFDKKLVQSYLENMFSTGFARGYIEGLMSGEDLARRDLLEGDGPSS